eukprot:SAG31_NODE_5301_length_2621_cov_10.452022_3_plen_80_part_00
MEIRAGLQITEVESEATGRCTLEGLGYEGALEVVKAASRPMKVKKSHSAICPPFGMFKSRRSVFFFLACCEAEIQRTSS